MNPPFDRFDSSATQWRAANALALAHAARLAYEGDQNKILQQLQDWGFPAAGCRVFRVNTAQVLAAANEEMIAVAFRGTQPDKLADWLVDAEIIQKPWRNFFGGPDLGRVHHGFVRNTSFVWEQLSQFVAGVRTIKQSLWITGHSLGGAMALIAAAAFVFSEHQAVNGLYTLGQPRTGNCAFAAHCNRQLRTVTFRVVNDRDIVPHVPPAFIPFLIIPLHGPIFYRHAGRLLQFDAAGKLRTDVFLWWRTALRLVGTRRRLEKQLRAAHVDFPPLSDHSLAAYIRKLQAWLDAGNP
ncbi:MAG TPA: lipase family protein [Verrucomicrobiae bacterium]|nr:lipase family protein [Verrucomicrobiae bacterium]